MTPDRSTGRGLVLEPLWTRPEATDTAVTGRMRGGALPPALATRYGPRLAIPLHPNRPTIVANFVASLDGVVAMADGSGGGGEISGWFEPDRFVMGLLRSLADAIVVGAGTVRHAPAHEWTPRRVNRAHAADYEAWRGALGLAPQPTTVVVTATGDVDPAHPALCAPDVPVVVLTTAPGARHLADLGLAAHVRVVDAGGDGRVAPAAVVDVLRAEHAALALCEGGPHLLADLVAADLVDELFLTLAPQVMGRSRETDRLGFVEGFAAAAGAGRWLDLVSVHRGDDHLFLRHRRRGADRRDQSRSGSASSR